MYSELTEIIDRLRIEAKRGYFCNSTWLIVFEVVPSAQSRLTSVTPVRSLLTAKKRHLMRMQNRCGPQGKDEVTNTKPVIDDG